jgi:hypothetical protein
LYFLPDCRQVTAKHIRLPGKTALSEVLILTENGIVATLHAPPHRVLSAPGFSGFCIICISGTMLGSVGGSTSAGL